MKGKLGTSSSGFTIVETLIVLAVTGFLFAGAMLVIAGKQNATEFSQAIHAVQSQIQQSINEVSSGSYQNADDLKCIASATGPDISTSTAGQGTNKDCIFLGRVLQFGVTDNDPPAYNEYTLVGLRGDDTSPSLDLVSAKPRVVAQGVGDPITIPDEFSKHLLLGGIKVSSMYYGNVATNKIGAVGFASSLGSLGTSDSSQQVNVVAIPSDQPEPLNLSKEVGVSDINDNMTAIPAAMINPTDGVQICFTDGSNRSGLITIGGGGRLNSVELAIKGSGDCS